MPLVVTKMEKVLAISARGDYCLPARTGMLCYSDEHVSYSVLETHSALAQCHSLPPAPHACTLMVRGGTSKFCFGRSALL